MSAISAGTVTLTNGDKTVTGLNTAWSLSVVAGDIFSALGTLGIVDSVQSNTQLTLATGWFGATGSPPDYAIISHGDGQTVRANRLLLEYIDRMTAGAFFRPDATGSLAQRDNFDAEPAPFFYAVVTSIPYQIYAKASDAPGDWSGPSQLFPKGDTGPQGAKGDPGSAIGDAASFDGQGPSFYLDLGNATGQIVNGNLPTIIQGFDPASKADATATTNALSGKADAAATANALAGKANGSKFFTDAGYPRRVDIAMATAKSNGFISNNFVFLTAEHSNGVTVTAAGTGFLAPVSGFYRITFNVLSGANGVGIDVILNQTGTNVLCSAFTGGNAESADNYTVRFLTAGDQVNFFPIFGSVSSAAGSENHNKFSMELM